MAGEIGKRAEEARLRMRVPIRQADLARQLGRSSQLVNNWLKGRSNPPPEVLPQLAALLDTSPEYLAGHTTGPVTITPSSGVSLKLYGSVSAGDGNSSSPDSVLLEDMPPQFGRSDYGALIIEGDSMLPFLEPSDICVFKDWTVPKLHQVFAAELPDHSWVVKQLAYKDGQFVLQSLHGDYPELTRFRLGGFLVGIVRDSGNERLIRMNPLGLMPPREGSR